ncbi:MAG TPA: hypothetical protein VMR33_09870 [Candidatus Baltobacteraceae bacterium]|jgi:hypothetical protein|nr:hypothetical protein [Candidatus Baltobacteraceae bacterium]
MDESGFKRDSCTTSTVDDEVWLGMASTYKLSDHVPACYAGYQSIEEVMTISPRKSQREFAKIMTAACVRRGYLEKLHAGITPVSRTGDYSDVKVVDGEGREIPWNQVSRINQAEMKTLMTGVVNRIYTFLARTLFSATQDKEFEEALDRAAGTWTKAWEEPKNLPDFLMARSDKQE